MVRPTLDVKKLQSVQDEALQDTNKDVKQAKAAATAQPPTMEKKKFDEKNAMRQKVNLRMHRDKIRAFKKAAEARKKKYSDLVNDAIDIGAKQLGIEYE